MAKRENKYTNIHNEKGSETRRKQLFERGPLPNPEEKRNKRKVMKKLNHLFLVEPACPVFAPVIKCAG